MQNMINQDTRHRGSARTEDVYKGIPVDAALGMHQEVVNILNRLLPNGGRIADIGAGRGSLSLRMSDAGFEVVAFDLDARDWQVKDIQCYEVDVNSPAGLKLVGELGPYDAIVSIEVIEHLENPRQFLGCLLNFAKLNKAPIIVSTPNPLDTFSAITFFRKGMFNWFSPAHYSGGGHISILPFWLINEHLNHFGVRPNQIRWTFLAPWKSKRILSRLVYRGVQFVHRLLIRRQKVDYTSGQSAIVVVTSDGHE